MPRTARIALPNYPHHVIQRGHNRQAVFADLGDYRYYLANLATWKTAYDCKVYAYCLKTNHVHLIIDPGDTPEHLGMLMKRVAGRQSRYVNRLEGRSGTLWEGRKPAGRVPPDAILFPSAKKYAKWLFLLRRASRSPGFFCSTHHRCIDQRGTPQ